MTKGSKSVLSLDHLIFDKIEFRRIDWIKIDSEFDFEIEINIVQRIDEERYKVEMNLKGEKPEEYELEITLLGFFSFDTDEEINKELKDSLLYSNTVAIMMPYMRSQVSLLTAQPGLDVVQLPIFNVSNTIDKGKK